jgi:CRISPR-associated protein Cmx8
MTAMQALDPGRLATRVHSLVRAYVYAKAELRSRVKYDQFKASGYKDREYIGATNKVCLDAFYAVRSRKERADFVEYFTGTICSVPQSLHGEEYNAFAMTLLSSEGWQDIKSLTLLALSSLCQMEGSEGTNKQDGGAA